MDPWTASQGTWIFRDHISVSAHLYAEYLSVKPAYKVARRKTWLLIPVLSMLCVTFASCICWWINRTQWNYLLTSDSTTLPLEALRSGRPSYIPRATLLQSLLFCSVLSTWNDVTFPSIRSDRFSTYYIMFLYSSVLLLKSYHFAGMLNWIWRLFFQLWLKSS